MGLKLDGLKNGYPTVTAYLSIRGAARAIEFYKKAFGATELVRNMSPDGKMVWHAQIRIGDSVVMISDEFPESAGCLSPESLGGTTVTLQLHVDSADAWFKRAVDAGARVAMPLGDMFWGDRYGIVTDPFGHRWAIASPIEQLTPEQTRRRAAQQFEG